MNEDMFISLFEYFEGRRDEEIEDRLDELRSEICYLRELIVNMKNKNDGFDILEGDLPF